MIQGPSCGMNPYFEKNMNDGFILSACHSRLTCVTLSLHPYTNCGRRKISEQYDSLQSNDRQYNRSVYRVSGDQNHINGSLQFGSTCLKSAVIFTNLENKTGAQNFRELFSACSCLNQ